MAMTVLKMAVPTAIPEKEKHYEICGHEAHFVEIAFIIVIPVAIGLAILSFVKEIAILSKIEAIILTLFMALAIIHLWNYETTKKIAKTSEALQKSIADDQENLKKMVVQNEALAEGNKGLSERLDTFKKAIGLLGGSLKNIDVIEKKMTEILGRSAEEQVKRKKLFDEQLSFIEKQERDMLDRQKALLQQKLKDQVLAVDEDKDGQVNTGAELSKIKKFVKEAQIEWDGHFDVEKKKGELVPIFEVMDQVDKIFEAHYAKIQEALSDKRRVARAYSQAVRQTDKLDHKPTEKKA